MSPSNAGAAAVLAAAATAQPQLESESLWIAPSSTTIAAISQSSLKALSKLPLELFQSFCCDCKNEHNILENPRTKYKTTTKLSASYPSVCFHVFIIVSLSLNAHRIVHSTANISNAQTTQSNQPVTQVSQSSLHFLL